MNLKNKVAVVTGASTGIGKAIAKSLSEQGCKVILSSRSTGKLEEIKEGLNTESMVAEMDVSDPESVSFAFKKIIAKYKRINILVNCAGVKPLTYLKNRHLEEWMETMEVNVKGSLRCINEVLPSMKKNNGGHKVNIASVDGKEVFPGGAVYGASKAALFAL